MPTIKFYWNELPVQRASEDIFIPASRICKGDDYGNWNQYFDINEVHLDFQTLEGELPVRSKPEDARGIHAPTERDCATIWLYERLKPLGFSEKYLSTLVKFKLAHASEDQIWLEARGLLNGALKTLMEYRRFKDETIK